jgi:hypothetical protein
MMERHTVLSRLRFLNVCELPLYAWCHSSPPLSSLPAKRKTYLSGVFVPQSHCTFHHDPWGPNWLSRFPKSLLSSLLVLEPFPTLYSWVTASSSPQGVFRYRTCAAGRLKRIQPRAHDDREGLLVVIEVRYLMFRRACKVATESLCRRGASPWGQSVRESVDEEIMTTEGH